LAGQPDFKLKNSAQKNFPLRAKLKEQPVPFLKRLLFSCSKATIIPFTGKSRKFSAGLRLAPRRRFTAP
jgi:hypothetical protein